MSQTPSEDLGCYFESGWKNERLDSWKEIAEFFRREVRTVQLWEKREGLPIRRQQHTRLGSVYAFRRELEQWWIRRSVSSQPAQPVNSAAPLARTPALIPTQKPAPVSAQAHAPSPRILPLPFEVIHNAGERNQVREAMTVFTEELRDEITALLTQAQLQLIIVHARSLPSPGTGSPGLLKTVAKEFQADLLLRVTVRYTGVMVRISLHLLDGEDLGSVWSQRAECDSTARRPPREWFRIEALLHFVQDHAVKRRRSVLRQADAVQSLSQSACNLGLHYWNQRNQVGLLKAVQYFEEAAAFDARSAEAYAGLANAYVSVSFNHLASPRLAAARAQEAVQKALLLDQNSLTVRNALINVLTNCTWDWARAEQECKRAMETGVMDGRTMQLYASVAGCQGRHQEALSLAMYAIRLDPNTPAAHSQISQAYLYAGDYDNALLAAKRFLALRPDFTTAHALIARILAVSGDWDSALTACRTALATSGNSAACLALMAYVQAGRGNAAEAIALLETIKAEATGDCFPAYEVSAVHAALRQEEQALEQLQTACTLRDMRTIHMNYDPRFEMLRSLPGFQRVAAAQTRIM